MYYGICSHQYEQYWKEKEYSIIGKSKNLSDVIRISNGCQSPIKQTSQYGWCQNLWIRKCDAELKRRTIMLLVDNYPAYPDLFNLKNIEITFFPGNTTSTLKLMD